MPVPGPRTQDRPLSGYSNPEGEYPDRLNLWKRPGPIEDPGRTPGTMIVSVRGHLLAAGTVRRIWQQTADYIAASAPYSWTRNAPGPDRPVVSPDGFAITRAVRYMSRMLYIQGGTDNTRYVGLHTKIASQHNAKPVSIGGGQVRGMPTVRNRMTSFGARVRPLNSRVAANSTPEDGAT